MSNLPHTLKVDSNIKDDYYKNYDAYNMTGLKQQEDYLCVLENVGQELPEIVLGLNYRAATSKAQRKDICENKYRKPGSEAALYIRKDDWISDKDDLQCAVYKTEDDSRETYKINGEYRKFPSKKLCDKYKTKGNQEFRKWCKQRENAKSQRPI